MERKKQAFAAVDPVPLLLQLLPTYPAIHDLVGYYFEAVREHPSRGQSLASALVRVGHSPDAPILEQDKLFHLIDTELADIHFKYLCDDDRTKEYGPDNVYLLDSLLSGLSLKHGLTATPDMYGAIDHGLNASRCSEDPEALVMRTCIQLLLHSFGITFGMAGCFRNQPEKVVKKLKAKKKAGTVKGDSSIGG